MKKQTLTIFALFYSIYAISQQIPTGSPPVGTSNTTLSQSAWFRGGNNANLLAGSNNIFGTLWNSPIYTRTHNVARTKLNGTVSYSINAGANANREGFILIGRDNNLMNGGNIYNGNNGSIGAFSLLHLNGDGSEVQQLGYRNWMRTGITFTGNRDLSYFGLRKLSTNDEDFTETTLTWSDNVPGDDGADDFAIRFTSGDDNGTAATVSTNFNLSDDLDGLQEGDSASWKQNDLTLNV